MRLQALTEALNIVFNFYISPHPAPFYLPPTKLLEGNVFSRVCLFVSVGKRVVGIQLKCLIVAWFFYPKTFQPQLVWYIFLCENVQFYIKVWNM